MQRSACYQAVCEVLQQVFDGTTMPADKVLRQYIKIRRYIGSRDRQLITTVFYGILRHYFEVQEAILFLGWRVADVRSWVLVYLVLCEKEMPKALPGYLTTVRYGMAPITSQETEALTKLEDFHPQMIHKKGFSEELYAYFQEHLEKEEFSAFVESVLHQAPTDVRVNTLKTTRQEVQDIFESQGWNFSLTNASPYGLRFMQRYPLTSVEAFKKGFFEIQDEGAQILSLLCDAMPGKKVLDMCAGAGGKSLALGMLMKNKGTLVLADIHDARLREASKRCKRAGLSNHVIKHLNNHRDWFKRQRGTFDIVLADVPCSGTGTWRRHVDAKIGFVPQNINSLIKEQRDILTKAASLVKPGGRLIYGTCSILPQENEHQVVWFLENNADFSLVPAQKVLGHYQKMDPYLEKDYLKIPSSHQGPDGFFGACFEKVQKEA